MTPEAASDAAGSIAGLILAAGRGTRFGPEPKLLAVLDGQPLVRHAALAALRAGLHPVLAVTGHQSDRVTAALDGLDLAVVRNPAYASGLSTSLRAGLDALPAATRAVVVLLGDMPLVAPATIQALAAAFDGDQAAIVPTCKGRRGNPVLLAARLFPDLRRLTGDAGAGALLRARPDVLELPVADPAILADIDTPRALSLWTSRPRDR